MVGAITPSDGKLLSKGVQSVRQHIALLKDYTDLSLEEFIDFVRRNLCDSVLTLTAEDIREIEAIEREYLSEEFIYGHNPRYSLIRKGRIEGVGELEVRLELKNNVIKSVNMMGDYFLTGDIDNGMLTPLRNVPFDKEHIAAALPDRLDDIVMNLKKEDFINILLANHGK